MKFNWKSIKKPVFVLAPMANITTLPFRSICRDFGADIVYTPMLSSNAVIHNTEKTLKIGSFLPEEKPVIVQLFGYDGSLIAKAANLVNKTLEPAGIDINLGCPAPKITGNECGSALLKDTAKATEIIKIVRDQFDGQLSVKMRLGWALFDTLDFVKSLENIGIDALSVHGRTAKQGYKGESNWIAINQIADKTQLPVIGNGDVKSWEVAYNRLEKSRLVGVMIGRGALGNPWIFKEIRDRSKVVVTKGELVKIITFQANRYVDFSGERKAMQEMRKHLGWYIKDFPGALTIRKEAMQINTYNDLLEVLKMLESY